MAEEDEVIKKGPLFEAQVVRYLQDNGWPDAERRFAQGANDKGDVRGFPITLQIKNTGVMEMGRDMTSAAKQAKAGGTGEKFAVCYKRRQHSTEDSYVVLPLWLFTRLVYHVYGPGSPFTEEEE